MIDRSCEALLLDYAAGALDPAQEMIVAAYLTLSPDARRFVAACEAIGGAMMTQDCEPSALSPGCLESLLAKIDCMETVCHEQAAPIGCAIDCCEPIPQSLARLFPEPGRIKWKRAFGGMEWAGCRMQGSSGTMRMIRADPGFVMPRHIHGGLEITLILDGAIEDEHGRYVRGDLFVMEVGSSHEQIADRDAGCLCCAVSTGKTRFPGLLQRVLQRFA